MQFLLQHAGEFAHSVGVELSLMPYGFRASLRSVKGYHEVHIPFEADPNKFMDDLQSAIWECKVKIRDLEGNPVKQKTWQEVEKFMHRDGWAENLEKAGWTPPAVN